MYKSWFLLIGIGLGIAKALAKEGANIVINGRGGKPKDEASLCDMIKNTYNVNANFEAADMSNPYDIDNMIKRINSYSNGIDILVNNAGIQHVSPVKSFPTDQWNTIIAINLSSVFHTSRLVLPYMEKQNWGRIINIASVHGLVGSVNKAAYVSAKHGVLGLTKVTALEYAHTGITINAICPGWVLTPLVQKQIDDKAKQLNISVEEAKTLLIKEKQPSGQFITPEQIGDMTVFLSSNSAQEIRGSSWVIDGGWTSQ